MYTYEFIIDIYKLKTTIDNMEELEEARISREYIVQIFNEDDFGSDWVFKLDFLVKNIFVNYSASILNIYMNIFKKTKKYETYLKKDVYDFTELEMLNLLKSFKSKSLNSINNRYSLLRTYIEIAKSYDKGNVTAPSSLFIHRDQLKETVNEYAVQERYYTRTELEEKLNILKNPNDKIVFMLIYEGVFGNRFEDLLNLKESDIDLKNNIIHNLNGVDIRVSDYTIKIIRECSEQEVGFSLNSDNTGRTYKIDTSSPYVIKGKKTLASNGLPLKYAGLGRKLDVVKKSIDMTLVTAKTLLRSGMMERMLLTEHNELEDRVMTPAEAIVFVESLGNISESVSLRTALETHRGKFKEDLVNRGWKI